MTNALRWIQKMMVKSQFYVRQWRSVFEFRGMKDLSLIEMIIIINLLIVVIILFLFLLFISFLLLLLETS